MSSIILPSEIIKSIRVVYRVDPVGLLSKTATGWTTITLVLFSSHNLPSIVTSYMVSSISLAKRNFERWRLYLSGMEIILFIAACMLCGLDL